MSVGEICMRDVVVIEPGASVAEAARLMRTYHVGDLVVAVSRDGHRFPVGILTDRDLVIEVLAGQVSPDSVTVGDVMSDALVVAKERDVLLDVIEQMRDKGVRRVPVVSESGALEGILAVDDLIDLMTEQMNNLVRLMTREQRREHDRRTIP